MIPAILALAVSCPWALWFLAALLAEVSRRFAL
jgi:hypothetical protein